MDRILEEMAAAIYKQAPDKDNLVLVGIRTGGSIWPIGSGTRSRG